MTGVIVCPPSAGLSGDGEYEVPTDRAVAFLQILQACNARGRCYAAWYEEPHESGIPAVRFVFDGGRPEGKILARVYRGLATGRRLPGPDEVLAEFDGARL